MIRAVIDQQAFEQLVAGKPTVLIANSDIPRDELLLSGIYKVEVILSDIGFIQMLRAVHFAAGATAIHQREVMEGLNPETKPHKELPEDHSDYCVERDNERRAARDSERARRED